MTVRIGVGGRAGKHYLLGPCFLHLIDVYALSCPWILQSPHGYRSLLLEAACAFGPDTSYSNECHLKLFLSQHHPVGSAGGERLFYCFCSHLRPRNKEVGGHFLQLQNFFLIEAKQTSSHSNGRGMPKSEIWLQEVPVSLQKVLEDGVGLEGVSSMFSTLSSEQGS